MSNPARDAPRYLAAIYRLARGRTDVVVTSEQITAELQREALLELTDEQFEAYEQRIVAEVQALRAAENP